MKLVKKWTKKESIIIMKKLFNEELKWDEDDIKLNLSKQTFKEYGLQSMLINLYKGSPYSAIKELYPNIKPWELKWCPRNYWNKETAIRTICWLFNDKLKWNKDDVLNKATKKIFIENNLGSMIHYIYKDNISKVVNDVLPYIIREY